MGRAVREVEDRLPRVNHRQLPAPAHWDGNGLPRDIFRSRQLERENREVLFLVDSGISP